MGIRLLQEINKTIVYFDINQEYTIEDLSKIISFSVKSEKLIY